MNTRLTIALFIGALVLGGGLPFAGDHLQDKRPNVILIDIDRLNADRMPCYGYHRNTTPNLCEFGKKNIIFKEAISQAGWTAGSVSSVMTSQYPEVHGIDGHGKSLDENHRTMAEILNEKGYSTVAFPAYPERSAAFIHKGYNLDQGFDNYSKGGMMLSRNREKFLEWSKKSDRPFFAYIQGFEPHKYAYLGSGVESYYRSNETPKVFRRANKLDPEASMSDIVKLHGEYYFRLSNRSLMRVEKSDLRYVNNKYDDSIREADASFGALLQSLKNRGMYKNSIVIVFANHGEMLDSRTFAGINRRFGHGQIWDDDIRVPLMIHVPSGIDVEIDQQVQLIDILPTVLEELGINAEKDWMQGESLKPLYTESLLYSDKYESEYAFSTDHGGDKKAVRNESWKLVVDSSGDQKLYNLLNNPNETVNVLNNHSSISHDLYQKLESQSIKNQKLKSEIKKTE